MSGRQRPRASNIAILLLLHQLFGVVGINRIPPVTLFTLVVHVVIFLRLLNPPWKGIGEACISSDHVLFRGQWKRLIFAAFEHADDWHLYYNMVSFVWKGISLEKRLGSRLFFGILASFTVLVNVVYVLLMELAEDKLGAGPGYRYQCVVGFSGA